MSTITHFFDKTAQKNLPDKKVKNFPEVWQKEYFKTYPRFPQIEMPVPKEILQSIDGVIRNRKSTRQFINKDLDLQTLSTLLFYSAGISALPDTKLPFSRRVYPSAGARYPLEVYINIIAPSPNIPSGTYHYNVQKHSLEQLPFEINKNILEKRVLQGANGDILKTASMVIFISAAFQRTHIKYGNASFRYICMEAGHMMQNIYLIGEALGLGCCAVGGFVDSNANKLFYLYPSKERMLYIGILGVR